MRPTSPFSFRVVRRPLGNASAAPLVVLSAAGYANDAVIARRARWRERITAALRSRSLDEQLAAGIPPAASAPLSLRGQALGENRHRRLLAERIQYVLGGARGAHRTTRPQVARRTSEILAAAPELEELVARLLDPGPLAARGLAQLRVLLTDGRSPLYFADASEGLRAAVGRALEALHPAFGW